MGDAGEPERPIRHMGGWRQPEPKVAIALVEAGHPILAFLLAVSWVLTGSLATVASVVAWLVLR